LTGVVVPLRAFADGKSRLSQLAPAERSALIRRMAGAVVDAAREFPTVVVSSDDEVRRWAAAREVATLDDPGTLDGAAELGVKWVAAKGHQRAIVAHADLPLARSFAALARDAGRRVVAAVPCRRDDGTPVLSVPADLGFAFAYGPGSFRRHAAEARRLGAAFRVVRDPNLAHDVDTAEDLLETR
jgi:2-phospho-L-lactate guanylyltransferase